MKLRWLGNSCVEIIDDLHTVIDPNYVIEPEPEIDYVLVTHEHNDHIDVEKLKSLKYKHLVAPEYTLKLYNLEGIKAEVGKELDGIRILPSWCWKAEESVSYYYKGVLHSGDSAKFPDVKDVKVAFTACFPDFYDDYVREMKRLKPELVIPIHYDPERKLKNAEGLVERLRNEGINARIVKIGEVVEI
ncbi:MBL fold metallo-hydrolase [Archaeoglobus profundus]|uniref:Zn-dependent hydrolase of the beta-lactamase fold-like protein n=1 Tax=Archaeoglobus profundus (strain DSM 5631 / JCM 9629 / NBRC 100127 / Av18) TaxID=572546 RepID=D2RGM0_ARCPA|nr:MBL fold metallo-hydrolase [Archaeoglobus profundus]ADB57445.1 Zn-dependent hydrolase of the beta-lactamase fold-like protein [Archaeoglobus profundus DSM 5631]